jgi:hypothetical protein
MPRIPLLGDTCISPRSPYFKQPHTAVKRPAALAYYLTYDDADRLTHDQDNLFSRRCESVGRRSNWSEKLRS